MTVKLAVAAWLAVWLLGLGALLSAEARIQVSVGQRFSYAPSTVKVKVSIPSQPDNRAWCLYWEGPNAGSSCRTMDGADSAVTYWMDLKSLPAGYYTVWGIIYGSSREARSQNVEFEVLEPGGVPPGN